MLSNTTFHHTLLASSNIESKKTANGGKAFHKKLNLFFYSMLIFLYFYIRVLTWSVLLYVHFVCASFVSVFMFVCIWLSACVSVLVCICICLCARVCWPESPDVWVSLLTVVWIWWTALTQITSTKGWK